jgi:hypothetical protein
LHRLGISPWRYTHRFMAKRARAFEGGAPNSQEITHENNLVEGEPETKASLRTMAELGDRLGPLLQLPPSFTVEGMGVLEDFLKGLPEGFRYAFEVYHSISTLARFLEIRGGERR